LPAANRQVPGSEFRVFKPETRNPKRGTPAKLDFPHC
jgi:hypothetical protein